MQALRTDSERRRGTIGGGLRFSTEAFSASYLASGTKSQPRSEVLFGLGATRLPRLLADKT